jgi:glutamine cyclotransferase
VINPSTWNVEKTITVFRKYEDDYTVPIDRLNDLEFVNGKLLVNIYLTTYII